MYIVYVWQIKKVLVLVDAIANGLWGFMWFVCFCYTADQWRRMPKNGFPSSIVNCGNSGVAFSFFSIIVFVSYINFMHVQVHIHVHACTCMCAHIPFRRALPLPPWVPTNHKIVQNVNVSSIKRKLKVINYNGSFLFTIPWSISNLLLQNNSCEYTCTSV